MSFILVLTASHDTHADIVCKELFRRGLDYLRFDTDTFVSQQGAMTAFIERDGLMSTAIAVNGVSRSCGHVSRVWYRKPTDMSNQIGDSARSRFARRELRELLDSLGSLIPSERWVSSVESLERSKHKLLQLSEARKLGFAIPRSCASNDPEVIRNFVNTAKGQVVYKTLFQPRIDDEHGDVVGGIPTSVISPVHLEHLGLLRASGGMFQEYIEKAYEVRVTVIGNRVFSARIDSQVSPSAQVDWRKEIIKGGIPVSAYQLSEIEEQRCRKLISSFGLVFGAIDLIAKPDGEYVFLELNPNGQWYWVEHLTGMPMVSAMADLLST